MRRRHQNRSEGLDGDPYERKLGELRTHIRNSKKSAVWIAEKARLNVQTVRNVISGQTARPHDRTVEMIYEAIGLQRSITRAEVRVVEEVKVKPHWPGNIRYLRERKTAGQKRQERRDSRRPRKRRNN